MANEITIAVTLKASKNGAGISVTTTKTLDMAGTHMINNVQSVGTSWEQMVIGDVSGAGFVYVKNLDATNYVEVALANDGTKIFQKILPGEATLIKAETDTMYLQANGADCDVEIAAVEL